MQMKIFLTGFMGSGKTSVGKLLALELKIPFLDQDTLLEAHYGKTVSAIFEEKGETVFRGYERDLLRKYQYPESFVFSTGGGCPCFHGNIDWMNKQGISIYLQASASLLADRLKNELVVRPLLSLTPVGSLEEEIALRLEQRAPFYEQARICIKMNTSQGPEEIASLVIRELQK